MRPTTDTSTVLAARVRSCDSPQYVALDQEALAMKQGHIIGLEQCDGCGCSQYRIVGQFVVCHGDEYDTGNANEIEVREGCGAKYPIREYLDDQVQCY